jgi:hypothetical protein
VSDFKPSPRRGAQIKKPRDLPRELILGYTRTGRPVLRPTGDADATTFVDWTRGDHSDAAVILKEHREREPDRTVAAWCKRWASTHKALGGR